MSKLADELAWMNENHAVIMVNGKVRVLCWEPSRVHKKVMVPRFASVSDMKAFYANRRVRVGGDEDGKVVPVFDLWMKSKDRTTFVGVDMDPSSPPGAAAADGQLNLWRGLAVPPKQGDWSLLRRHIEKVTCCGVPDHAAYVMRWIAWRLQHPTKPPEVALVMSGLKGTGKGAVGRALCHIFGAHAIHISSRQHLAGNFNAHMMQACMVFADEAYWPGDKQAEGNLKRLITEPTLFVEMKGVDAFEVPNHTATVIAGNETWLVPASDDERRYAVFRVSDAHRGDRPYFKALFAEMENGGLAAMLHDALAMDIGGWHPRDDIPDTEALRAQQGVSARPEDQWLGSLLEEGMLPFSVRDGGAEKRLVHRTMPSRGRTGMLFAHAKQQPGLQHWTLPQLYKYLDEHGIASVQRLSDGNYREFPPLPVMRAKWLEQHPWWPPFQNMKANWQMPEDDRLTSPKSPMSGGWSHVNEESTETPF